MNRSFEFLSHQMHDELIKIADWWVRYSLDNEFGGFYGEISNHNRPVECAEKTIILNARILWFFSALARRVDVPIYEACAHRAFNYVIDNFYDKKNGGFYWSVNHKGNLVCTEKSITAQAQVIYALSEYYLLSKSDLAFWHVMQCFDKIQQCAKDSLYGGYFEFFTREWKLIKSDKLQERNISYVKSKTTHLHLLEATFNLYKINKSEEILNVLKDLIYLFKARIFCPDGGYFKLHMLENWQAISSVKTYGHDFEIAWLLNETVDLTNYASFSWRSRILALIDSLLLSSQTNDGLFLESSNSSLSEAPVWWVQTEALTSILSVAKQKQDASYLVMAEKVLTNILANFKDAKYGEWQWFPVNHCSLSKTYKVGPWKCPYHNGRAMMYGLDYLKNIQVSFSNSLNAI